jgi:hypothetical protein
LENKLILSAGSNKIKGHKQDSQDWLRSPMLEGRVPEFYEYIHIMTE